MNYILKTLLICLLALKGFSQDQISFSPGSNNQTFNTCNGFIIDSGGQGGTGYSDNEDITITICPDTPGEIIAVVFNLFNLNTTDDNPAPNASNVDYMMVYDGTSTAANTLGTYSGNQLQGVVIQATELNPSGCLTFRFKANTVGTGSFAGQATCETPCANPFAGGEIVNGITADSIQVCVGEEVFFQESGSAAQPGFTLVDYEWDFMDGTTASGADVSHIYNTPGQYRVQLFVTDDNGCSNPNLIDLEVLVGTHPTFDGFPADLELCLGETVDLSVDPETYEVEWSGFPGSESVDDGCLTDDQLGVAQEIELLQTGFDAGTTIQDVSDIESICLDMEHSFVGDLVIILECPNGQSVVMHQQGGGGTSLGQPNEADNVDCDDPSTQGTPYTYCFTPDATNTWVEWIDNNSFPNELPGGDYESVEPLDQLVGCPTNGVWTLSVIDNWAADDGTLFSFGLTLDPSYYPDITTFTPQIGNGSDSSYWQGDNSIIVNTSTNGNDITVEPTTSGSFDFTYFVSDNFGCSYDSTVTITVNENATLFAGNDTTICQGETILLNPVLEGLSGGCSYTLSLDDTFGDGWNGNTLTITVDGVASNYTLAGGSNQIEMLSIANGSNVTVTFNAEGSWVDEANYTITDEDGAVILTQGPNLNGPVTDNFVAACQPDYIFDWQAATNLDDNTIQSPTWSPTGDETLTLSVYPTGHPDCISTDDIAVTVILPPNAGEDGALDLCESSSPVDLFNHLGGTPDLGGIWKDPNGNTVNMPFNPATMPAGPYKYIVGDAACIDEAAVMVSLFETTITDLAVTDVDCNSADNGSVAVNGVNIENYSLNGGSFVATTTPFTIQNLAPGNYTLDVSSNLGCTDQATFVVIEPNPLQITSISNDTVICVGENVTLTAQGIGGSTAHNYNWYLNGANVGAGQTITVVPNEGINTYCVRLTEACGSPYDEACMIVENPTEIVPMILGDTLAGCSPHQVDFTNISGTNEIAFNFWEFSDGDTLTTIGSESFEHTFEEPGLYDIQVTTTSIHGCVYTNEFIDYIEVYQLPEANFNIAPNPVTIFDPTVKISDNSSVDVVEWLYVNPMGTPEVTTLEDFIAQYPEGEMGTYPVTLYVTTEAGCVDSITKDVLVVNDILLFAPTAFTPDGDEFNQTWSVHISGIDVYDYELNVYNRWGEVIWESHDVNAGWDGTYDGRKVQSGMYVWTIECKDLFNDEKYTFNGSFNLIR